MADQTFNYQAWRARLGITAKQAAEAIDVSYSMYCKLEREGTGRKVYAWAAYGVEAAARMHP